MNNSQKRFLSKSILAAGYCVGVVTARVSLWVGIGLGLAFFIAYSVFNEHLDRQFEKLLQTEKVY